MGVVGGRRSQDFGASFRTDDEIEQIGGSRSRSTDESSASVYSSLNLMHSYSHRCYYRHRALLADKPRRIIIRKGVIFGWTISRREVFLFSILLIHLSQSSPE